MSTAIPSVVLPSEGETLGLLGVIKVPGTATGGTVANVEHVIPSAPALLRQSRPCGAHQ